MSDLLPPSPPATFRERAETAVAFVRGAPGVSAAIFVPLAALAVIIDALAIRLAPTPVAPRREEPAPEQVKRRAA